MSRKRFWNLGIRTRHDLQRCLLQIETLEARNLLDGMPLLESWMAGSPDKYAQAINGWAVDSGPSTTWPDYVPPGGRYNGGQATPVLADIHQVSYSDNWVYVQAPGLASYVMGPWFQPNGQVFPNFPSDQNKLVRIAQNPQPAVGQHDVNGLGSVGIWVNGVSMFNMLDGFSWSQAQQQDLPGRPMGGGGDGFWNRDANVAEGPTFDYSGAHQPQNGEYHYHANPVAVRAQLNDNIAYTGDTDLFPWDPNVVRHPPTGKHDLPFEEDTSNLHHSPILGWSFDGYPVYGPYGYSDPTDPTSPIRPMVSSYQLRDITQRTTLPGWAAQMQFGDDVQLDQNGEYPLPSEDYGPPIDAQHPLGWYTEDYEYISGLGDLDQYNGRWTVTPEYPNGTYAYFVTIDANGNEAFPYVLGREYYGQATSGRVRSIDESVTVYFDINGMGPGSRFLLHEVAIGNQTVTPLDPMVNPMSVLDHSPLAEQLSRTADDFSGRDVFSAAGSETSERMHHTGRNKLPDPVGADVVDQVFDVGATDGFSW